MSLQVWLPLTKDLRQQGLSDVTVTNNGATFNSAGKLGGCYGFDGDDYITIVSNDLKTLFSSSSNSHSMACWIYLNSDETDRVIIFGNYSSNPFINWELTASEIQRVCAGGTSNYTTHNSTTAISKEIWVHIAYTYNGSQTKFYINGTLINTVNGSNTLTTMTSNTFWLGSDNRSGATRLKGRLNDFRIYDHCLSPMEVKKLAQGLILHYPLNRHGLGQENLYHYSKDFSNWTFYSGTTTVVDDGETVISYPNTADAWPGAIANKTILYSKVRNKTITVSADLKADSGISCGFDPCLLLTASETSVSRLKYKDNTYNFTGTGKWIHWSTTYNITDNLFSSGTGSPDYTNCYFSITFYRRITPTGSFKLKNPKVELGSIATPWCPNSSDELATTMGINNSTEYDISGFGNNGTRINFPQQNLLLGSDFSTQYTTDLVLNSSTDWTKYLRGYNTNTLHNFNSEEDTITLSTASNLGVCFARKATDINLDSNSYYTLSCEAKSTQTAKPLCIGLSYYNNSNTWVWRGGTNPTNFTTTNTWQKFSLTFKPDADTQYICYCFTVVGVASGTDTFTIRHCKLEKGSVATPWVEDSYSSWSSDTPKYNVSTKFNGSNYIKTFPGEFSWSNYDNLTIAAWMKPVTTPASWTGSIGIAHDGSYTNKAVAISNYGGKFTVHIPNGTAWGTTQSTYTIPLNTWHHCVATIEGTVCKMYVDGVLNKTFTIDWGTATNHTNPQIEVGVDLPGTDEIYNGYYSDARIYATALSADDVKSLYQNCATIGPDGTTYGQIRN